MALARGTSSDLVKTKEVEQMKKAMLIVNPSAGGETAKNYVDLAQNKLESMFDQLTVSYTEKGGDAERFARQAADERYDSVFVMGGDGTVNEGISGLAEQDYRPKFGFIPLGTVNDLARSLGISLDPEEAIIQLSSGKTRPLDIGKINDQYFMNVVAIGTLPQSVSKVDSEEKTKWGKAAYFISGVQELIKTDFHDYVIGLDDEAVKTVKTSTILVGLTNSIGGFERILPEAKVDDGLLHLIYLKDQNLFDTLKAVPDLVTGAKESTSAIAYRTFQKGEISLKDTDVDMVVNVDGDEGAALPVKLEILPSHLEVYY